MTIEPDLSRKLMEYFADSDDPVSISKGIDLILSTCPGSDMEHFIFHILCVDETGGDVLGKDTGLPTTIIKSDWLAV